MKNLLLLTLLLLPFAARAAEAPSMSTPMGLSNTAISYFGYYSSEIQDVNAGNPSFYAYNLIAINYKLSSRFTVSARPTFTYDSAGIRYGEDMPARTKMADSHFALIDKAPFSLPFDLKTKAIYKIYVPTDPEWQQAGTYGGVGAELEMSKDFANGFSVGYYPKAFVLAQKQSTFVYQDSGMSLALPTQISRIEQWFRVSKYFGDKFNISQGIGLKDEYFNGTTVNQDAHSQYQLLETTLNFEVNDNIDLSFGIGQTSPIPLHSFSLYRDVETAYLVMTSIRM
ncbi:MAG TPA: hypothetical protein VF412_18045 [Bdellovibrio sp.]|uniref:hypothetical protein n=1 Tax=Bdellovibrio sp. TaxID=28201 RepID=UPI002F059873